MAQADPDLGEWDDSAPAINGRIEVNARFVGYDLPMLELLMETFAWGAFGFGHDATGSGVLRFMVEETDKTRACLAVTEKLLEFENLAVFDVRPGPYAEVSPEDDTAEERRFEEMFARLAPELKQQVWERLEGYFASTGSAHGELE